MSSRAYVLSVATSRPDLDQHLIPGSACTIRLAVDLEGDDLEHLDLTMREPPLMFTVALPIVSELIRAVLHDGFIVQVEPAEGTAQSWRWPASCSTEFQVSQCLQTLREAIDSQEGALPYPVLVWVVPGQAVTYQSDDALDHFRERPHDIVLWRELLDSGVGRITITEDTCSLSLHCRAFQQALAWVRRALDVSPFPIDWIP